MVYGPVAPIATAACTGAATSAQPALPACDALCVKQSAGMSTSPDAGSGKSSLPAALDMLGASPELVLSEGSFRFQANTHAGAGLQPGVLFTPVLRSRANEEPSVSGACSNAQVFKQCICLRLYHSVCCAACLSCSLCFWVLSITILHLLRALRSHLQFASSLPETAMVNSQTLQAGPLL